MREIIERVTTATLTTAVATGLTGCGSMTSGKRTIRISHVQSETHPGHIGLLALKEYMKERLENKYEAQTFPNRILSSAQKAIKLTQTGIIDLIVAETTNPETFTGVYEVLSIPYLFSSKGVCKSAVQDMGYMEKVYESTNETRFRVVTWYSAGTRNSYVKTPIHTPDDLRGKEIRAQQSPASVVTVSAFETMAASMGFDEVYMAIQQGVVDGAEDNELALANNKHGEIAKYCAYNKHQIVPDMLVANLGFLDGLNLGEYQIFKNATALSTEVELKEQDKSIEVTEDIVQSKMGAGFIDVDVDASKQKVLPPYETILNDNPKVVDLCDHIQKIDKETKGGKQDGDSA